MEIMGNAEELEQKYGNERKAPMGISSLNKKLGQKRGIEKKNSKRKQEHEKRVGVKTWK